jgi:hypothetical protein
MASIYTARNLVGNDKTTPLFSLKGLPNLAPSTVTHLNIHGIPLERQVAYAQYSANISSFIHALAIRKTIVVSPAPLGLPDLPDLLPLSTPTVSFTLQKPLSSDQTDRFIKILGPGASKSVSGKTTIYHAPGFPLDQLGSIIQLATPFFNSGRDSINPRGLRAYQFLNNIIVLFLKVHSYSAFQSEDTDSITMFEQLHGGPYGASYMATRYDGKDKEGNTVKKVRDVSGASYSANEYGKRARDVDMDGDDENTPAKKAQKSDGYFVYSGLESVFKAKPSKSAVNNIGASSEIPKHMGHVFPYFLGLMQPDATFMNSIVLRRFYQLLGGTHESAQSNYLVIRHGINSLATTDRGMEIRHMLLGIDLALETQSRCFIIIEKGAYLGFCLLGARYAIFCNTKWFSPASEEDLHKAILRMDPHESAIDDMIERLESLRARDQFDKIAERSMFSEPKLLAEALGHLKIDDIDEEDSRELDRCVRNLNYMGAGYLTKNPQMISEMLETISTNRAIELDRPTYIPSIRAPLKNRLFAILSRFGPDAPSFWNDRGKEIMCKPVEKSVETTGGKRKLGSNDIFGNMPDKMLITPKPLLVAVKDMERVIEKSRVKMDVTERAARYRNILIDHEETRKRMWKALVDCCANHDKKPRMDDSEGGVGDSGIDLDDIMFKLIG